MQCSAFLFGDVPAGQIVQDPYFWFLYVPDRQEQLSEPTVDVECGEQHRQGVPAAWVPGAQPLAPGLKVPSTDCIVDVLFQQITFWL